MNQSVERTIAILETLSRADRQEGCGVHELAAQLGLKAPTVHAFLKSLAHFGYVERTPKGRYVLGYQAELLGMRNDMQNRLILAGRRMVCALREKTGENVILCDCPDGLTWHPLINVESAGPVRINMVDHENRSLFVSATGRVMLAEFAPEALLRYCRHHGLPDREWEGITSVEELQNRLEWVRKRQCEVIHRGEITGLAVPVRHERHRFIAAIGIYLGTGRFTPEYRNELFAALHQAAAEIIENF